MRKQFLVTVAVCLFSVMGHAEIAILCGDLEKIQENDEAALVHVDFDSEHVSGPDQVKFFYQLGKKQNVVAAQTMALGTIMVTTTMDSFTFFNVNYCEHDGSVIVKMTKEQLPVQCLCYSD